LWDNLAGLGQAALDAFTDPVGIRRASQLAQALATNGVDGTAAKVWDGITKPYTSRWNSGDQAGAIGYGVVEIAITLAGTKGATKLATATRIEASIATNAEGRVATFVVDSSGGAVPTEPGRVGEWLSNSRWTETSTNPGSSRKFVGADSDGTPVRIRVERGHPEDAGFTGVPDPLHTGDHLHVDGRVNGMTGKWQSQWKIPMQWPW
jgi:hypothetical protein